MRRCGAAALAAIGALTGAWAARADRPEPVPLYGAYDTYLDHARQTFEGRPDPSAPSTQAASFTTTCTAQGCVAHWLRVAELSDNPMPPHCSTTDGTVIGGNRRQTIRSTVVRAAR